MGKLVLCTSGVDLVLIMMDHGGDQVVVEVADHSDQRIWSSYEEVSSQTKTKKNKMQRSNSAAWLVRSLEDVAVEQEGDDIVKFTQRRVPTKPTDDGSKIPTRNDVAHRIDARHVENPRLAASPVGRGRGGEDWAVEGSTGTRAHPGKASEAAFRQPKCSGSERKVAMTSHQEKSAGGRGELCLESQDTPLRKRPLTCVVKTFQLCHAFLIRPTLAGGQNHKYVLERVFHVSCS